MSSREDLAPKYVEARDAYMSYSPQILDVDACIHLACLILAMNRLWADLVSECDGDEEMALAMVPREPSLSEQDT